MFITFIISGVARQNVTSALNFSAHWLLTFFIASVVPLQTDEVIQLII
ncbi:hypothetical protein [Aquimarina hainanensis]